MSLQSSNMFEKYHRLFEGNERGGQRYQVILSSGQVYSGIPVSASGSSHSESFEMRLDSGSTRAVEWNRLLTASAI